MVYHDFVENWFSHSTKKFYRGTLHFPKTFFRKSLWIEVRYHGFLSEHFCLTVPEKFRRGTFCLSESFWYRKFWRIRGVIIIYRREFLSHIAGKFRRGSLHFSENFFYRKSLSIGGGYHDLLSKLLCLTLPKNIPRRTLLFQKISGLKKLHKMVFHDFVEIWFSHSTDNFRRRTLHFSEKLFIEKFKNRRWDITTFSRNFFVSQCRKNS